MDKRAARAAKNERLVDRYDRAIRRVLKGTREDLDLSQEELADKLGWTRDQVVNVEVGRRKVRAAEIPVYAEAYGVTQDVLWRRIRTWA